MQPDAPGPRRDRADSWSELGGKVPVSPGRRLSWIQNLVVKSPFLERGADPGGNFLELFRRQPQFWPGKFDVVEAVNRNQVDMRMGDFESQYNHPHPLAIHYLSDCPGHFFAEDLPKVALAASEAYKYLRLQSFDQSNSDDNEIEEEEKDEK